MITADSLTRVHLLNLSVGGALIYAADPPEPGTAIRVRCGAHLLPAQVAWKDHRRFGVTFVVPLTDADLNKTIAEHDARVSPGSQCARSAVAA
ncbi:PilZ domain-containing protein [Sphingomonas panacisoli]